MKMREYYLVTIDSSNSKLDGMIYLVSSHIFLDKEDIDDIVMSLAARTLNEQAKKDIDEDDYINTIFESISSDKYLDLVFDTEKYHFVYSADIFANLSDSILTIYQYEEEPRYESRKYLFNVDIKGVDCKNIDFAGETEDNLEELIKEAYGNIYYQLRRYFDIDGLSLCTGIFYIMALEENEYQDYQEFQDSLKLQKDE